jgi:hypothetical protein
VGWAPEPIPIMKSKRVSPGWGLGLGTRISRGSAANGLGEQGGGAHTIPQSNSAFPYPLWDPGIPSLACCDIAIDPRSLPEPGDAGMTRPEIVRIALQTAAISTVLTIAYVVVAVKWLGF